MNRTKGSALSGILISLFLVICCTAFAHACNSMANNRWGLITSFSIPLLLPMVLLIPAELSILRNIGGLEFEYVQAYLYCLPAKIIPLVFLSVFYKVFGVMDGFFAFVLGELAYSAIHFIISFMILNGKFRNETKNVVLTATLISTVIPWAYTAGIPLTLMLML